MALPKFGTKTSNNGTKSGNRWDMSNWTPGKVTLLQAMGLGSWNVKYPQLTAQLPNQYNAAQQTNTPPGKNQSDKVPATVNTGGKSGMKGLYNALRSVGASPAQAVGLIANAMNESTLDPEAVGDGGTSFGLWQFHEPSYPGASGLVTGHPAADFIAQIKFLVGHGGLNAASGSTASQVAGNFAANFERCQGCDPGGYQYNQRVGNVQTVLSTLGINA